MTCTATTCVVSLWQVINADGYQRRCTTVQSSDRCRQSDSACVRERRDLFSIVQRRFTKRLQGLKHLKYGVRLTRLGLLPSLELRRLHLDLLYCYLQNRFWFGMS